VIMVCRHAVRCSFWERQTAPGILLPLKYIEYFVVFFMTREFHSRRVATPAPSCHCLCNLRHSSVIGILHIPSGERVSAPFEGQYGEPKYLRGISGSPAGNHLGVSPCRQRTLPMQIGWYAFAALIVIPLLFTLSRTSWACLYSNAPGLDLFSPRRMIIIGGVVASTCIWPPSFMPKSVVDR